MAVFSTSKFLNINNGPGAWRQFLVDLALGLISFAEAAIEFKTGVPTKFPKRPTAHDFLEDEDPPFDPFHHLPRSPTPQMAANQLNLSTASTMPQPATPLTNTAAESKTPTAEDDDVVFNLRTPFDLPGLLPLPTPQQDLPPFQHKYRHQIGSHLLTDAGHSDLRQDQKEWDAKAAKLQDKRRSLIEYVLSICHTDSLTALNSHPEFMHAVESLDVVKIHHLITVTHTQENAVISLNTMYSFLHCSQGDRTLEEFGLDVKHKTTSVISEFEDLHNPGYIKTSLLVNCVLLKGVNKEMAPLITNLLTSPTSNLRSMTDVSIMASFRKFKNNTIANNQNRQLSNQNPNPKNRTQQHNAPTAALATPHNPFSRPPKENKYKFPDHPHSRETVTPVNSGKHKGDPALPHCTHCLKAGYISNNHTVEECYDLGRFVRDTDAARKLLPPTPANSAWNQQAALARTQQAQSTTQQANLHAALATPSGQAALSAAYMQGVNNSAGQLQIDQAALARLGTAYGTDDHAAGGGHL